MVYFIVLSSLMLLGSVNSSYLDEVLSNDINGYSKEPKKGTKDEESHNMPRNNEQDQSNDLDLFYTFNSKRQPSYPSSYQGQQPGFPGFIPNMGQIRGFPGGFPSGFPGTLQDRYRRGYMDQYQRGYLGNPGYSSPYSSRGNLAGYSGMSLMNPAGFPGGSPGGYTGRNSMNGAGYPGGNRLNPLSSAGYSMQNPMMLERLRLENQGSYLGDYQGNSQMMRGYLAGYPGYMRNQGSFPSGFPGPFGNNPMMNMQG